MTLLNAEANKIYSITKVTGDEFFNRRLLDMGFTPKTQIYIASVAPFGGTILVGIRGSMVALRDDAACLIGIEPYREALLQKYD